MNKINFVLVLLAVMLIGLGGCSKKGNADRIIGKWKAQMPENGVIDSTQAQIRYEIFYEFTKDKMIVDGSMELQPIPRVEIPYIVKSSADTVILNIPLSPVR